MASRKENASSRGGHVYNNIVINGKAHLGNVLNGYPPTPNAVDACRTALFLTYPLVDREQLRTAHGQRTTGTCEWILENVAYQSWLREGGCLGIAGGPGKGKTMLSIFLSEELERHTTSSDNTELLFYFCTHQDEKRNSASAVLRSLVFQLLKNRPGLYKHVSSFFEDEERTQTTRASEDALWIVFNRLLRAPDCATVFCLIDGLDECDAMSIKFLAAKFRSLFSAQSTAQSHRILNLAIVSRAIPDLDTFTQIHLDPHNDEFINRDLERFISAGIKEIRAPGFDKDMRSHVQETLLARSQGTFLWAGFVMRELLQKRTCIDIIDTLNGFPSGLPAVYGRMLHQVDSKRRHLVCDVLCWVATAARPLSLEELSAAVDIPCIAPISRSQATRDLVSICGPILQIIGQHVSLIHQSAREYLLRKEADSDPLLEEFRLKEDICHAILARKCLDHIDESELRDRPLSRATLEKSPLLPYAVKHWPDHARRASARLDWDREIKRPFFQENSDTQKNWWAAHKSKNKPRNHLRELESGQPPILHIASWLGLPGLVEKLLSRPSVRSRIFTLRKPANEKDGGGSTALYYATSGAYEAVVRLLLDHGADVDAPCFLNITALTRASLKGDLALVRMLVERGANVNAGWSRHNSVPRMGLRVGLILNPESDAILDRFVGRGFTPLLGASTEGHEAVVRFLLERGARHDSSLLITGEVALHRAVDGGNESIVRLLLRHGADTNAEDMDRETPLIHAASRGKEAVVQLLLEHGAKVDTKSADGVTGWTALQSAASRGNVPIVRLLLAHGADVDRGVDKGVSAMSRAVEGEHGEVIKMLLEHGATPVRRGREDVGRGKHR